LGFITNPKYIQPINKIKLHQKGFILVELPELIERIKDVISKDEEFIGKSIHAKDVARVLKINYKTFITRKLRGKISYKEMLDFCYERDININEFLYSKEYINK
jgi:hypothetical protein